jgi:Fe-S-cluster containining protein
MSSRLSNGKMRRFITSLVLPVDESRSGECRRCGACCKFVVVCPFLKQDPDDAGAYRCSAYKVRPLQCRKYPRSKGEQVHQPCGYVFRDSKPKSKER